MHYSETELKNAPQLIAGTEIVPLTTGATIAGGQGVLPMGAVLGMETATEKYFYVDSSQNDGRESPCLVLPQEVDTTEGDVFVACYKTGVFNRDTLSFGGTDTADTHEAALRLLNIHMRQDY